MTFITDLLSGRLFKFRIAAGSDVNTGTNEKMLVSPKSIKTSDLGLFDKNKQHTRNTDNKLDEGGTNELSALQLKTHINDATIHRQIDDIVPSATTLFSSQMILALLKQTIVSLPIVMTAEVNSGSTTLVVGTQFITLTDLAASMLPLSTGNTFTARLYVVVKVDSGVVGEACLVDGSTSTAVAGSTISFNNTTFQIQKSAEFTLSAGKYLTYGIKRISGGLFTNATIKATLLTLRIP